MLTVRPCAAVNYPGLFSDGLLIFQADSLLEFDQRRFKCLRHGM